MDNYPNNTVQKTLTTLGTTEGSPVYKNSGIRVVGDLSGFIPTQGAHLCHSHAPQKSQNILGTKALLRLIPLIHTPSSNRLGF